MSAFAEALGDAFPARRTGLAREDREALAKALALLSGGTFHFAHWWNGKPNLNWFAFHYAGTPSKLNACLEEIKVLRVLLMQTLCLRA